MAVMVKFPIYGENKKMFWFDLRGKFMGKIYGENLRGKYAGKIYGKVSNSKYCPLMTLQR